MRVKTCCRNQAINVMMGAVSGNEGIRIQSLDWRGLQGYVIPLQCGIVVVEDGRQVEPAPPCDLEIGEVRLPELVRRRRLVPERIGRLDNDEGRTGDQIMSLQDPIDGGFGDKVTLRVGEPDRQLPRR